LFSGVLVIMALAFVFWLVEVVRAKVARRPTSWETYRQELAQKAERDADTPADTQDDL
jgi:hypothetical protein